MKAFSRYGDILADNWRRSSDAALSLDRGSNRTTVKSIRETLG
ncbi:MAG: hypothetical protein ABIJ47_02860 [Candidatus Bathyarchaeota archaeon]